MKAIASYNIKGGVGKTTTIVNLAYVCAAQGSRTLIWDLDPQGASTFYFRIKPKQGGAKRLIEGKRKLESAIRGTDYEGLDLLRASFSYRNLDLMLASGKKPTKRIAQLLARLEPEYDWIFLDCPAGITLVSDNVFRAVDALVVPTIPTVLSVRTLEQLRGYLHREKLGGATVLPFFSMVDTRRSLHWEIRREVKEANDGFLKTFIPYASAVERMGLHREPLPAYAPGNPVSKAYAVLWSEIRARLCAPGD